MKILVPTDLSEVSLEAIEFIMQNEQLRKENIILVYVVDIRGILSAIYTSAAELQGIIQREAEKRLRDIEKKFKEQDLNIKHIIRLGEPSDEIVKTAIEKKIDHIIVSSHGKGILKEMFVGSVAVKVARKSPVPVTIVKPKDVKKKLNQYWKNA